MFRWSHTRLLALRRVVAGAVAALVLAGCGDDGSDAGDGAPPLSATPPAGLPIHVVEAIGGDDPPVVVATLGDSITAGIPGFSPLPDERATLPAGGDPRSQWQYWAAREVPGTRYRNCGVGGQLTEQIAVRLEGCARGADVLVVQGGTNDIAFGRQPWEIASNLRFMVRRGKELGLRVAIVTVPPIDRGSEELPATVRQVNARVRAIAEREEVLLVDWHDILEDPAAPGRMAAPLSADGVHPSIAGYRRIGEAFRLPG